MLFANKIAVRVEAGFSSQPVLRRQEAQTDEDR
jgi:hypothetical protein